MTDLSRTWPSLIEEVSSVCGYFTRHTEANNGYGCLNRSNELKERGVAAAPCLASSCPVANRLSYDEPADQVIMMQAHYDPASLTGDDWMLPYPGTRAARAVKARALKNREWHDPSIQLIVVYDRDEHAAG